MTKIVEIDFSSEPEFELIPPGTYPAGIDQVEYKIAKTSGLPMLTVAYILKDEDWGNRKLWSNYSLSQSARFKLRELFKALDIPSTIKLDVDDTPGQKQIVLNPEFYRTDVLITVVTSEYQGTPQASVDKVQKLISDDYLPEPYTEEPETALAGHALPSRKKASLPSKEEDAPI